MLIDITYKIDAKETKNFTSQTGLAPIGHLGTHFDIMDKSFPLEYTERGGVVFDVSDIRDRDIEISDIDLEKVQKYSFVAICSGFIEEVSYNEPRYFKEHPQLSNELIDALIDRGASIIGIDFAGVRRGSEHSSADKYCADRGVFIVENLCNLKAVIEQNREFTVATYPMNFVGFTGVPCRVVAKF